MAPRKQSRPWHREVMVSLGFSCFLATMLLYSAAAMPFQRFATLPGFVNAFSVSLQTAAAAGFIMALLCVCKRTRRLLAHRLVCGLGVASYLAGNAMFCTMALFGAGPAGLVCATGCLVGLGSVLQCRAWGSMLAAFDLRRATSVVAASAIAAALIGWAQLALPPAGAVALFMACSTVSAALPLKPTPTDQNPRLRNLSPCRRANRCAVRNQNPRVSRHSARPIDRARSFRHDDGYARGTLLR